MKKKIRNNRRKMSEKILSALLSVCIAVGGFALPAKVEAKEQLVNVALDEGVEVIVDKEDTAYGGTKDKINDGKEDTAWAYPATNEWPVTAQLDLAQTGTNVSKVVVKLGGADGAADGRKVDVTVQRAQNGITTDLSLIGEAKEQLMGSEITFELSTPVSASDIYVTLSNPKTDETELTFWPAIAEIEVYEVQDVKLSEYNNIANQAEITTTGWSNGSEASLVDGNDTTLYKFHDAQLTEEKEIALTYSAARAMDAFRIAFEHVAEEPYNYQFTYSILAKGGEGEFDTIVDHATANRTDNWEQEYKFDEKPYSQIKIVMHSCTNVVDGTPGIGWPAVAEFEVYGSEETVEDSNSIAWRKPVHASSGKDFAKNITDGSKKSVWRGDYYPAYVDIDLEKNYNLDTVEVFTPERGYSQYSIYTSLDGRDFTKLAEKTGTESANLETGEVYQADGREARIVRVYMEYNSVETAAIINEVRVTGTESGTVVKERPAIDVVDFDKSEYANKSVTENDTYEEVYGIIRRRLNKAEKDYTTWFDLKLAENPNHSYDYFRLSMNDDGKVLVEGNDGVSLATGINHYLKYFCNVNISQVGDQVTMPETKPVITEPVFKETKAEVRYSYNYCTLSYSMAFWGETEWRNELDWLALNGVNVVLDATAQEEVWRRFLGKLGYEHEDIKDFIAGPAYYAWAYMANLSGFGGPIHDSWFEERTELARKNQQIMRNLGMQPVLQGYSGMVPTDIKDYDPNVEIIEQGTWCSFRRPDMLLTTSVKFDEYAKKFYDSQKEVYGEDNHYYATDPFHEGGNTAGLTVREIPKEVLTSMIEADPEATWIIQSWQGNPKSELLKGLDEIENGTKHALVLDLYAEKDPHYDDGNANNGDYGYTDEFDDTPWLFCMLNNFGGRLGLHGHLDNLANNIPIAFNTSDHIKGIGITPEASVNNPVLYDFLFETVWQDDANANMEVIDLDAWLHDYAKRRYGAESDSAYQAWKILKDTVYKASLNMLGQGAPESVVNARPRLDINAASTWGNAVISYDKAELEKAAELLLRDYELLKDSEGYQYDVVTVLQQVLSNSAQEYQKKMTSAFNARDKVAFKENSEKFLGIIDKMEEVTSANEYYLLGRWVEQAKALGKNADDFSKDLYEFNAKALITTWGSYNQAETGGLKDYSNRQWSGLLSDFYKVRWKRWIDARTNELNGAEYESNINWFQWEWTWARGNKVYDTEPKVKDLSALGKDILEKYAVPKNPAANDEFDLPLDGMTATAGSAETGQANDVANNVLDDNVSSLWHTAWGGTDRANMWIDISLGESELVNGLRMLPRSGAGNGTITGYRIEVSNDNGENYHEVATGTWANDSDWKWVQFEAERATNVRLYATGSVGNFASAAEIRIMGPKKADYSKVDAAIAAAKVYVKEQYTTESWNALQAAIAAVNRELTVGQQNEVDAMAAAIEDAIAALELRKEDVPEEILFTVTVDGKELGTEYRYNAPVELTENNAVRQEGKTFAGWKVDGKLVSVTGDYKFYVSNDVEVTSMWVDATETVEQKAEALMTSVSVEKGTGDKSNIKFVGQLIIPDGYEILQAGLVWSTKSAAEKPLIVDGKLNSTLKPTYISKISDTNQFSVTIKGVPKTVPMMRGRVFAVIQKKGSTEQKLIYSGEATAYPNK